MNKWLSTILFGQTGSSQENIPAACCMLHASLPLGKGLVWLFQLQAELATFFFFHPLPFLFERMVDKLWLYRLGMLVDIFLKIKEVSLLAEEKLLKVFVSNDRM